MLMVFAFGALFFAWAIAEIGTQLDGESFTADAMRAAGRSTIGFFESSMVVTCQALGATKKRPLELPEWTGRERESLRADLEAADKQLTSDNKWWSGRGRSWDGKPTRTLCNKYGLFPEALEAFTEGQEKSS